MVDDLGLIIIEHRLLLPIKREEYRRVLVSSNRATERFMYYALMVEEMKSILVLINMLK